VVLLVYSIPGYQHHRCALRCTAAASGQAQAAQRRHRIPHPTPPGPAAASSDEPRCTHKRNPGAQCGAVRWLLARLAQSPKWSGGAAALRQRPTPWLLANAPRFLSLSSLKRLGAGCSSILGLGREAFHQKRERDAHALTHIVTYRVQLYK